MQIFRYIRPEGEVRAATPDAFPSDVLFNATAAMAPRLHPALWMKWLYNDLDARFWRSSTEPKRVVGYTLRGRDGRSGGIGSAHELENALSLLLFLGLPLFICFA